MSEEERKYISAAKYSVSVDEGYASSTHSYVKNNTFPPALKRMKYLCKLLILLVACGNVSCSCILHAAHFVSIEEGLMFAKGLIAVKSQMEIFPLSLHKPKASFLFKVYLFLGVRNT